MECGLGHHDRPHSSLHEAWPEASSFVLFRKLHCRCPLLTGLNHFSERGWGFSCHFREPHIQMMLNCFDYVQWKTVVATVTASGPTVEKFAQCVSLNSEILIPVPTAFYTPNTTSFSAILQSSAHNLRYPKPDFLKTITKHIKIFFNLFSIF